MERKIEVGAGQIALLRCTGTTINRYRALFNRDLIKDITEIQKKYSKIKEEEEKEFSREDLEIFMKIAYTMAYQYATANNIENFPSNENDWLDTFDNVFSIYEIVPAVFEMWAESSKQLSVPKKK